MLSRATWVSLSFLFMFPIIKGKTIKQDNVDMYCDDEYREKYIVSTSLFNSIPNTSALQGRRMLINPSTSGEHLDENTSNGNSVENYKNFENVETLEFVDNIENSNSAENIEKRVLEKMHNSHIHTDIGRRNKKKVLHLRHHKQPKVLTVATYVNFTTDSNSYEEVNGLHRRKRQTWEGQIACLNTRRIIGGTTVNNIEQIPYIVFVDTGCGGTIISHLWVLSAAHCIGEKPPKYIYGGSVKLYEGCRHRIDQIIIHPHYRKKTFRADITLIKLRHPFIFSPAMKPLLLDTEKPTIGACGVISGWGSTSIGGKMEYHLKTSMLPIINKDNCKIFANMGKDQFCAGFKEAQTDSCQGDSGGPFVVNNLLVGIVSFGYKCAMREIPGVYVNVPYYRDWVENITGIY